MALVQNDKRKRELERLYAKPALRLDSKIGRSAVRAQGTRNDFLASYRPTLIKDAITSFFTLCVLILSQFVLLRFLK